MSHRNIASQLHVFKSLSALINSTLDTREIRKKATEAATMLMNAETGSLLLIDRETNELFFEVALGEKGAKLKEIRLGMGTGIAGWVAEHDEPLIIDDVQNDPRFFRNADQAIDFKTKTMICAPVKSKNKILGVLQAINKKDDTFTRGDLDVFIGLANHVAAAIENANLYEQLRKTFFETIFALAGALEKRDPYTSGHVNRVSTYAIIIGETMDLSPEEMEKLKLSAILHDIGKIGVGDRILLKESALDPDERAEMNRHSQYGADILGYVQQLADIIPGVRGHHENYDGSGYPDNLKGGEIPLSARIIAVADTFDAMTTDRPYRKALSFTVAIEELRKCSSRQFDPQAVEAMIAAYNQGRIVN